MASVNTMNNMELREAVKAVVRSFASSRGSGSNYGSPQHHHHHLHSNHGHGSGHHHGGNRGKGFFREKYRQSV